jgi:hypothetical protein
MKKFILDNQSDLSMEVFLRLVEKVVSMGRISNNGKQYCYVTSFDVQGKEYFIYTKLNKKSDTFVLCNA